VRVFRAVYLCKCGRLQKPQEGTQQASLQSLYTQHNSPLESLRYEYKHENILGTLLDDCPRHPVKCSSVSVDQKVEKWLGSLVP
jgi:hypothetical protein